MSEGGALQVNGEGGLVRIYRRPPSVAWLNDSKVFSITWTRGMGFVEARTFVGCRVVERDGSASYG